MKVLRVCLIIGLVLSLLLASIPIHAAGKEKGEFSQDRILVKFKDSTDEVTKQGVVRMLGDTDEGEIAKIGVRAIRVPAGKIAERLSAYRNDKMVEFVEPDYTAEAIGVPDDPSYSYEWGMTKIQASQAWDITTGQPSIKIAVLDTGIDQNHQDLSNKLIVNKNFTSSSTADDLYGHGTHVAGIAAASTNNGLGVAGIGYNSSIMNVKVLGDAGSGYHSWIASGIIWAVDNGAKVISMSLGGASGSSTLKSAIDYAWSKGAVIIAAAGNSSSSAPSYPAYYTNVIAVAATTQGDVKASFSNYGSWVDVAAPGSFIYSTLPNHSNRMGLNYGYASGTSMATPFVAGLAGLVWSTSAGISNTSVREQIESTADPIAGTGTYWQNGRINAYKAVSGSPPDTTPPARVNGLTVTAVSSSELRLVWSANAESDLEGYRVYRSQTSRGTGSLIASPLTVSYADTGLSPDITYYYTVSAVDASGNEGAKSTQVSGTTDGITTKEMHVSGIEMSLQNHYSYYTRAIAEVTIVDSAGEPVPSATVSGSWSNATTESDSARTDVEGRITVYSKYKYRPSTGTTYTFTVEDVSLNGWIYAPSANKVTSNSIEIPSPDTTSPARVNGLTVTAVSGSELRLVWSANAESDLEGYRVYRSQTSVGTGSLIASPLTVSYADTGLSPDITYYYTVSAVDASGNEGAKSTQVSGTTDGITTKEMHVSGIEMSLQNHYSYYTRAIAELTIVDSAGEPVPSATVSGSWSNATTESDSARTDVEGRITVYSKYKYRPSTGTTYTFTVEDVSLNGWIYAPSANEVTSNSIEIP